MLRHGTWLQRQREESTRTGNPRHLGGDWPLSPPCPSEPEGPKCPQLASPWACGAHRQAPPLHLRCALHPATAQVTSSLLAWPGFSRLPLAPGVPSSLGFSGPPPLPFHGPHTLSHFSLVTLVLHVPPCAASFPARLSLLPTWHKTGRCAPWQYICFRRPPLLPSPGWPASLAACLPCTRPACQGLSLPWPDPPASVRSSPGSPWHWTLLGTSGQEPGLP